MTITLLGSSIMVVYVPASQSEHAATSEAEEYFPLTHGVHAVAPVAAPVSVMDPGAQD